MLQNSCQPNFIHFMLRSRSRKFWKGWSRESYILERSESRNFGKVGGGLDILPLTPQRWLYGVHFVKQQINGTNDQMYQTAGFSLKQHTISKLDRNACLKTKPSMTKISQVSRLTISRCKNKDVTAYDYSSMIRATLTGMINTNVLRRYNGRMKMAQRTRYWQQRELRSETFLDNTFFRNAYFFRTVVRE